MGSRDKNFKVPITRSWYIAKIRIQKDALFSGHPLVKNALYIESTGGISYQKEQGYDGQTQL